jgi:hypothetical protein
MAPQKAPRPRRANFKARGGITLRRSDFAMTRNGGIGLFTVTSRLN